MRAKAKHWTEEEKQLLIEEVDKSIGNYSEAFRVVSERTGRTVKGVSSYWYNVLSKKQGIWMATIGKEISIPNKKVVRKSSSHGTSKKTRTTWWGSILRWFK